MTTESIGERLVDLTNRVFAVTAGLDLPHDSQWDAVLTVFLTQVNERLDSIRVLLDKNSRDSSVVLTRSLFELAVNLAYIAKDAEARMPEYLRHGGIPTTAEEFEKLREQLEEDDSAEGPDIVPARPWKPLKDMCTELGPNWLKEYITFYRLASIPTHAGSFTMGRSYKRLIEQQPPSDHEKATGVATALAFQLRVAEIVAEAFPQQVDLEKVKKLRSECQCLGHSLSKQQT